MPTKTEHAAKHSRRNKRPAADGRKAREALYVMLTQEQKRRYEAAAASIGMSMREYVVNALEGQVSQQRLEIEAQADGTTLVTQDIERSTDPRITALLLRLGTLEKQVAALQNRIG